MSLRATFAYFLTRGLSGALALATISLFARMLGPAGYAPLALSFALAAFVGGLLIQPLHAALGRFLPGSDRPAVISTLGRSLLLAAAVAVPLSALLEFVAPAWLPPGVALLGLVLAVSQGAFDFSAQYASSTLQPRLYAWLYLTKAVLALGVGALLLRSGAGAIGAVAAMAFAFLAATAAFGRKPWLAVWRGPLDRQLLPEFAAYALPVSIGMLTGAALQWSDRLILAAYAPGAALGAYGASADLVQQGFGLLCGALLLAWYPRLVAAWERRDTALQTQLEQYLRLAMGLLIPAAVGFALVAGDLSRLLLGEAYSGVASKLLPWLAFAALLGGFRMYVFDLPLHLSRRMFLQSGIAGGCAALGVLLNIWAVPRYGILAAAVVAVVVQAIGCGASLLAGRRTLVFRVPPRDVLAVLSAVTAMVVAVLAVPSGSVTYLVFRVFVGGIVYGVVLLAWNTGGVRSRIADRLRTSRSRL